MIASPSRRRIHRFVAGTMLITGAAAVSACSAGQLAHTSSQVPAVPGVNASAGPRGEIALRNVFIVYNRPDGYPQGGSAPLEVRIFNGGSQAIRLVRVTAEGAAERVELVGSPATGQPAAPTTATAPTPEGSPTGSPQAAPTASPAPTAGSGPTRQTDLALEIPARSYLALVPGQGAYLQLVGLTSALTPGESVPVTFSFANATSATVALKVPFGPPTAAVPRGTPVVPGEGQK